MFALIFAVLPDTTASASVFTNKIKSYGENLFACSSDSECIWVKKECCGAGMLISDRYSKRWESFLDAQCRGLDCAEISMPPGLVARCVSGQCHINRAKFVTESVVPVNEPDEPYVPETATQEEVPAVIIEPLPPEPEPVVEAESVKIEKVAAKAKAPKKEKAAKPKKEKVSKKVKAPKVKGPQFTDETVCEDLKRRSDQEKCYVQKMDSEAVSSEVCEGLKTISSKHVAKCYSLMAHKTNDLFFCNAIEDPQERFACYHKETSGRAIDVKGK